MTPGCATPVANRANRYHGPALHPAFSHFATKAGSSGASPEWVWVLDSDRVWRDPISPFNDDGDPAFELLRSCERHAVPSATFLFLAEGYVIHRGRGTLAGVASRDEKSNRFHEWAKGHHAAHFREFPGAAEPTPH